MVKARVLRFCTQVGYVSVSLRMAAYPQMDVVRDGWPFGHNRHGPKSGGLLCPFSWGELGSHLTQCHLGWGLPPCQVASWSIQPFCHNTPTLQTDRQDRQGSHSIGRTVVVTAAHRRVKLGTSGLVCILILATCDRLLPKGMCSGKIIDNISELVQDRDIVSMED